MIVYVLSLSRLITVLAKTVGGHWNGEPQIPLLSCISNAALLSLKLLLFPGPNVFSKKLVRDLSFNEDSNISRMIFHSQPHFEHTLGEKITVLQNNFTFLDTFFFKCPLYSLNVRFSFETKQKDC